MLHVPIRVLDFRAINPVRNYALRMKQSIDDTFRNKLKDITIIICLKQNNNTIKIPPC